MEITRLVDSTAEALSSHLLKLEQELTRLAEAEDLGYWMIAVREGSTDKTLKPAIVAFLQSHRAASVAAFASWDAKFDAESLPEEIVQLGLLAAVKTEGDPAVNVMPQVSEGSLTALGFTEQLADCVAMKNPKLRRAARPRKTHLAVVVEKSHFVADPALSPPPDLTDADAVDYLWVFLEPRRTGYRVWRVRRGDDAWQLGWRLDAGTIDLRPRRS